MQRSFATWRGVLLCVALVGGLGAWAHAGQADGKLDVYFIDTEGGAATLMVTPAGESVLVDTGNPGDRDPDRIAAAAKAAGLTAIDHVIITHYHVDHFGGANRLASLIPIHHLHDNGEENPSRDRPTTQYLETKVDDRTMISPGDLLPLKQRDGAPKLTIQCLAARKKFINPPPGAKENPFAAESRGKPLDLSDNANSVVLLVSFGDFRFYDGGDLTWNIEKDLASPINRIGTVDVYQVTHHGLAQSNNPVLVKAIEPTVAIMNNGPTKGGEAEVFATLRNTPSIKAIWQLHRNVRVADVNGDPKFIANFEPNCQGNLIHLSVEPDAKRYTVEIPATRIVETYATRPK
jgi:beta-lactamase superfamily II metal-dependent hydrolase